MAKLTELERLLEAFDGCCAVFHTSAFVDPAGLSCFSIKVNKFKFDLAIRCIRIKFPTLILMKGECYKFSLEAAKLAQSNASGGIYSASAMASRQARSLAKDAFFHPSIMSVSYYYLNTALPSTRFLI